MIDEQPYKAFDVNALEEIHLRHYRGVVYYIRRAGFGKAQAEDMVQDIFLSLFKRDAPNAKAFLYHCAKNKVIDEKRRFWRVVTDLVPERSDESSVYVEKIVMDHIYKTIESLPVGRRVIIKYYYIEGKTTDEIALILGISPQTVLNQKAKALTELRLKCAIWNNL